MCGRYCRRPRRWCESSDCANGARVCKGYITHIDGARAIVDVRDVHWNHRQHRDSDSTIIMLSSCDFYGPQTKILEGRSNIRERIFKALFTYVSTRFGLRSFEKCFENAFPNVCPTFQNLRLGGVNFSSQKLQKNSHDDQPFEIVRCTAWSIAL